MVFVFNSYFNFNNFFSGNNSESLLLYADCLYRANKKEECYGLLSSVKLSGARLFYLLARVSYDLNKLVCNIYVYLFIILIFL